MFINRRKKVTYAVLLSGTILVILYMIHTTNYGYYIGGGDVGISSSSIIVSGPFLCSANKGRLGNLMFEFASLTGIAALNNRTLVVGTGDYIYKVFDLKNVTVLDNRDVCNTVEVIEETLGCCKFDSTLMTLPRGKSFKIGLYLQSWKYFYHVQDEIRRQYQFRDHIKEKARYLVNTIRASYVYKSQKLIGIHVRIGDIANEMHNYRGLVIAPEGYIYKAMNYIKARFSDIIFVVTSDDLKWSRSVLRARANDSIYFLEEGMPPEVDLAVMASCDHVIQTVGTFSWWAGFLSGGVSIYYPHPGRIGSPGEARYNYADFFLPNWIPIDV